MSEKTHSTNVLNKLVICDHNRGKIKYVGPIYGVNNDSEIWYGIEWIDVTRGKHDGTYKGRKYFETKHPTSGSFVKPSKVDLGVDIWSALEERYFAKDEFNTSGDKNQDSLLYNNFNINQKAKQMDSISLARCKISSIESMNKLIEFFPNLIELDLEENLFCSWNQIFSVLKLLKNLEILNVSNNCLEFDSETQSDIAFENINSLILNRMNYDWKDINRVVKHFPKLVTLKVCFNSITEIKELSRSLIDNLRILDLESNPLKEWRHLKKLGELKALEILFANSVELSEICFEECQNSSSTKTSLFPKLKSLALNENRINDWNSINELNKLSQLEELRFRFNPLNKTDQSENIRQLVIAKIGCLKIFNRTIILAEERKGAEIDYLKKFGKRWLDLSAPNTKQEDTLDSFYLQHPRYLSLVKSIKIKNEETGEILQKKIPSSIEIRRLKIMICNLFKSSSFDSDSMVILYRSCKNPDSSYELDNDFRNLSFYSIDNGDTLIAKKI